MKNGMMLSGIFVAVLVSSLALAGGPVSDPSEFPEAAAEACEGKGIGADCTIEFEGGYLSFGICVELPGGNGELTCEIDTSQIPEDCQNNALGTKGSWLTFGGLAAILLFVRRRRS